MEPSTFETVAAQARKLANSNTSTDWAAVMLNIIAIPILMSPVADTDDRSEQKKIAMPDEWVASVAALPVISQPGLAYMAKALEQKGWISVADARRFVEIETEAQVNAANKLDTDSKVVEQVQGASLLLARAEKELPGTLQRFTEATSSFAQAANGVLNFTFEKTILVGKGLGKAADFLRQFKKY